MGRAAPQARGPSESQGPAVSCGLVGNPANAGTGHRAARHRLGATGSGCRRCSDAFGPRTAHRWVRRRAPCATSRLRGRARPAERRGGQRRRTPVRNEPPRTIARGPVARHTPPALLPSRRGCRRPAARPARSRRRQFQSMRGRSGTPRLARCAADRATPLTRGRSAGRPGSSGLRSKPSFSPSVKSSPAPSSGRSCRQRFPAAAPR